MHHPYYYDTLHPVQSIIVRRVIGGARIMAAHTVRSSFIDGATGCTDKILVIVHVTSVSHLVRLYSHKSIMRLYEILSTVHAASPLSTERRIAVVFEACGRSSHFDALALPIATNARCQRTILQYYCVYRNPPTNGRSPLDNDLRKVACTRVTTCTQLYKVIKRYISNVFKKSAG